MNKNFQIQISFSRLIEQYIKRIEERNKTEESIQEKLEKEKKISYINPSFLKLIFSYHSKSLIENQISLNTF